MKAAQLSTPGRCQSCHSDLPTTSHFDPYRTNTSCLINVFARIGTMNGYLTMGAQTINDITTNLGLSDSSYIDPLLDWGEATFLGASLAHPAVHTAIGHTYCSVWAFVPKRGGAARVRRSFVRASILKEELT
jgi:hypothetical protein